MRLLLKLIVLLCWLSAGLGHSLTAQVSEHKAATYWQASDPQSTGIDPSIIDGIHQDILLGKYGLIDHFMIIRQGKLITDQHYRQDYQTIAQRYDTTNHLYNYDHPAWHPYYNYTDLHTLQSVTKSVTSLLIGIAIEEGLMMPLDSPVVSWFSEYQVANGDEKLQMLTLRSLLTMQSGIAWDEQSYDEADNSCILMEASKDWIQFVLSQPMDVQPGTVFEYNSGASVLIGKLLSLATGMKVTEWAEKKLFTPLGITSYYWKNTPLGEIDTEGGLYLSSHDLAKIGYLMLQKGQWEGRQVVSQKWVEDSIFPRVKVNAKVGYGYQWWVPQHNDGQVEIFAGNGYGGQFVMGAPAYDLLVVFNGWNIHERAEKSSYRVLQDRIIPSLKP